MRAWVNSCRNERRFLWVARQIGLTRFLPADGNVLERAGAGM